MTPGCGLCGELVSSPHYCSARSEQAHARIVRLNEQYRAAVASIEPAPEHIAPDPGIPDLAAWGDWVWCQRHGYDPRGVDRAAVARAARVLERLSPGHAEQLWHLYVGRCTGRRVRKAQGRRPGDLPALTPSERAYLETSRMYLYPSDLERLT